MKKYIFLLLALTVGSLSLAQGQADHRFEGDWSAAGVAGLEGHGSYLNYSFENGDYAMEGYPPISESGVYEVIFTEEDEYSYDYTLKMTPHEGDPEPGEPYLLVVSVYADGKMALNSVTVFNRGYTFYKK